MSIGLALALAALSAGGVALVSGAPGRRRLACLGAGLLLSVAFVPSPAAWLEAGTVLLLALALRLAWPEFRGEKRPFLAGLAELGLFLGGALLLPLLFSVVAGAMGTLPLLLGAIELAAPLHAWELLLEALLATFAVVAACDGAPRILRAPRVLLGLVGLGLVGARVVAIASAAVLPGELFWPEAPFLVNALKLHAGERLYGAREALDSYSYSPLIDLTHHALLAPFGLELALRAHRVVVLVDQLVAAALVAFVVAWAFRRRGLRPSAAASLAIVLASLSNLLAPAVHPDHPLLLLNALAIGLLVADRALPRPLFWSALLLVTPVAAGFKLSGAGLGLGLAVVMLVERRWREVAVLGASALLTVATIPLFDATLGPFSFWTIRLQASHAIVWPRLAELPLAPFGLAVLLLAAFVATRRRARPLADEARRVGILAACTLLASLPAYLKYAGRDNNLTMPLVGFVTMALLAELPRTVASGREHGLLAAALALLATTHFRVPTLPVSAAERAAASRRFDDVVALVRSGDAHGRSTLLLIQTAEWIAAGHRDVQKHRQHAATELFLGGFPEASVLFSAIEGGSYDVIVSGGTLQPGGGGSGDFAERLLASLRRSYRRADGETSDAGCEGTVVWVRRW